MLRRSISAACILLLLVLVLAALWAAFDWPPPRLILKYGLPPTGGPTGRTMTIEGVEFVELKPGYFRMGSHFLCETGDLLGRIAALLHSSWGKRSKHDSNECPPHWVEVAEGFWIARTEVTNAQYEQYDLKHERGRNSQGDADPVTHVCFAQAQAYCAWLAKRSQLTIRLPSEAEWENACRAGSLTEYCFGDEGQRLSEYAWNISNSGLRANPVKTKPANAWGLYDMHGNVWEWCEDTWHESYKRAPGDASAWIAGSESIRVVRGGSWTEVANDCCSAVRVGVGPALSCDNVGFRAAAFSAP